MADDVDTILESQDQALHVEGAESFMSAIDELPEVKPDTGDGTVKEGATEADRLAAERAKTDQTEKDRVAKETKDKGTNGDGASIPDSIKGKARDHFKALEQAKADAEKKNTEWERKYKDLETKSAAPNPELDKIKAEREQLAKERDDFRKKYEDSSKIVALKAVEETEAFKTGVTTPRSASATKVKSIVDAMFDAAPEGDVDAQKERGEKIGSTMARINSILSQDNEFARERQIAALCNEAGAPWAVSKLTAQIDAYRGSFEKEAELRKEQAGNQEFATREQTEKEAKERLQRSEEWTKEHGEVKTKVETDLADVLDDKLKPIFEEAFSKSKGMDAAAFDALPARAKQFHNFAGWALPKVIRHFREELKKKDGIIAARGGSRVRTGSGGGGNGDPDDKKGMMDMLDDVP